MAVPPVEIERKFLLPAGRVEIDRYLGPLEGLLVAEVEFASRAAALAFEAPAWMGQEITENQHFKNKNLVLVSKLDEVTPWLEA